MHPYYPRTLVLPGWRPLVLPFEQVLAIFFGSAAAIGVITWLLSGRVNSLRVIDRAVVTWLVISGAIHFVVEGYVVLNPGFHTDASGNPLSEIWKEYSKADSRYVSRDSFTICMEAFTAFVEGPMCFATVYGLTTKASWRYTMQMLVSFGQLYGDVLYFATTWFEGLIHSRPEPLYFWFYFVGVNMIWIVVPLLLIIQAGWHISAALSITNRPAILKVDAKSE